jgi:hypothetical protein
MPMKRFNLLLVLIISFPVVLFSCRDPGTGPISEDTMTIRGRIENWTLGDTMVIRALGNRVNHGDALIAESNVDRDGNFSLDLPVIPDSLLGEFVWLFNNFLVHDTTRNYLYLNLGIFPQNSIPNSAYRIGWVANRLAYGCGASDYCMHVEYEFMKTVWSYYLNQTTAVGTADTVQMLVRLVYQPGWNKRITTTLPLMNHKRMTELHIDNAVTARWYFIKTGNEQSEEAAGMKNVAAWKSK